MNEDPNQEVTMINTRGRVVHAKRWMLADLRQQGMKIIVNPKREYYPEHDAENQRFTPATDNMAENIAEGSLLEVDSV